MMITMTIMQPRPSGLPFAMNASIKRELVANVIRKVHPDLGEKIHAVDVLSDGRIDFDC